MLRNGMGALLAAAALLVGAGAARAHDVKDPVCRMTVDSDTARWKHRLGNKSFYFCTQECQKKFAAEPARYEKLAALLEKGDLHEYAVSLETSPNPVAGKPVELAFAVRYKESGKLVTEFEEIHERLFHLIMVTEDLRWFEHQHPVRGTDGIFRKRWAFPAPGRYILYADFTPADGDNQVIPLPLTIGGGPGKRLPLTPDAKRVKQVGDYRIELELHGGPLRMERASVLTYTVRDRSGRPLRDMQPFIGAPGHLLAISRDGEEVVHTHALHGSTQPPDDADAVHVTPVMATEKGPRFSFKLTTPTAGLYRVWAQFMHRNRVITVPFTFDVQEIWGETRTASTPAAAAKLTCPVMKGAIADPKSAPSLRVNHELVRFCCAGCDTALKKEPAKYLKRPLRDPVTGKPFRVTAATPSLEHGGAFYLFASAATRDAFRRSPQRYAKEPAR